MGTIAVHLETFGCQMNVYDSELIRSILSAHRFCDDPETADVILLNTCSVRESACQRVYARIGDLKRLRGRGTRIGLLGCMAAALSGQAPPDGVDFVAGQDDYPLLPALVAGDRPAEPSATPGSEALSGVLPARAPGVNAWLAIMRGCDNACSFCIVPRTRGPERSRPLADILAEAARAVADGHPQVTLLGQNVNSWRDGTAGFPELLDALTALPGLRRIRFTSPHPKDFPLRLLEVMARRDNVCRHVHLPLQSGSDAVLARMNRGYDASGFLATARRIRATIPGVFLSTDIIAGFPGESADQHEDTKRVMREAAFESAFIFKYSPRPGTSAARDLPDDVPDAEKGRRTKELNDLQNAMTARALAAWVGREAWVLVEDARTPRSEAQCQGRVSQGAMVVLPQDGSVAVGTFLRARITGHAGHVLLGEPVAAGAPPAIMDA